MQQNVKQIEGATAVKDGYNDANVTHDNVSTAINSTDDKFFWALIKEDVNDKSLGWKKKLEHKEEIEIQSWQRKHSRSNNIIHRSEVLFKGIKQSTVIHFIKNYEKYLDKDYNKNNRKKTDRKILEVDEEGNPKKIYSRWQLFDMSWREKLVKINW